MAATYIGKVQIGSEGYDLIGSTLYGICTSEASAAAKTVIDNSTNTYNEYINAKYNALVVGTTIHVKFLNGNSVTNNITLAVGATTAQPVIGLHECDAETIISFTLDEQQRWIANDNIDTNTEYLFDENHAYNALSNKAATIGTVTGAINNLGLQDAAQKGVVTNIGTNTTSTDLPTTAAVVDYVGSLTGGLAGLTGAMHFRGIATSEPTGNAEPSGISAYDGDATMQSGDVVLYQKKEYVWNGTEWQLLGDEGSYALKSNQETITEVNTFTPNTLPQLTIANVDIPNIVNTGESPSLTITPVDIPNVTAAGSPTTASVSNGVLTITIGEAPTLGNAINVGSASGWDAGAPPTLGTSISVGSASGWNAGSKATLQTNDTIVVVPGPTT